MTRYKVIADWPGMAGIKVGDIIKRWREGEKDEDIYNYAGIKYKDFDKYPHLFKRLEWWEDVSVDELPKYVRFLIGEATVKVYKWVDGYFISEANKDTNYTTHPRNWNPATEQEYIDWENRRKSTTLNK